MLSSYKYPGSPSLSSKFTLSLFSVCQEALSEMQITNWSRSLKPRQAKVATIKSKIRKWKDLTVGWICPSKTWNCSVSSREGAREKPWHANRHNGIKLTNKGRGPVRPELKDCSMHTNRPHAPIQEPFPKDLQTHKGWHPSPTLRTVGRAEKAASSICVFRSVWRL